MFPNNINKEIFDESSFPLPTSNGDKIQSNKEEQLNSFSEKLTNYKSSLSVIKISIVESTLIMNILYSISDEIAKYYKEDKIGKEIKEYITGKRVKKKKKKSEIEKEKKENKKKVDIALGRKTKNDTSVRLHNKYSLDNIYKSIKSKLLKYLVLSINSLFEKIGISQRLFKLNYTKNVDELRKEKNNEFLGKTLEDILSSKMSGRYKTYDNNYNINTIKNLKEQNKPIINYVLNLTFREWINFFIYKKESEVNGDIIKFEGIENCLLEIINKNKTDENEYISDYIYCLYNYERYFYIKTSRKTNK